MSQADSRALSKAETRKSAVKSAARIFIIETTKYMSFCEPGLPVLSKDRPMLSNRNMALTGASLTVSSAGCEVGRRHASPVDHVAETSLSRAAEPPGRRLRALIPSRQSPVVAGACWMCGKSAFGNKIKN